MRQNLKLLIEVLAECSSRPSPRCRILAGTLLLGFSAVGFFGTNNNVKAQGTPPPLPSCWIQISP